MSSLYREDEKTSLGGFMEMESFVTISIEENNPQRLYKVSDNIEELTGYTPSLFLDKTIDFFSLISVDDLIQFERQLKNAFKNGVDGIRLDDIRIIDINNELKSLRVHVYKNEDLITMKLNDVTEYYNRIKINDDIINRYKNLMVTLDEAIWDWNVKTDKVYCSKRLSEILGYEEYEIEGTLDEWKASIFSDDLNKVMESMEKHFRGETDIYSSVYRMKKKDGSFLWISDRGIKQLDIHGETVRMIESHRDITTEKEARENLEKMIITDELTGLYNRRHYDAQLKDEMLRAQRYSSDLSIVMLDIDLFKQINDTYGHLAGDLALQKMAKVINGKIRNTDSAYRTGGEEFIVIAPLTNHENAMKAAERLRSAVSQLEIVTVYGTFSFTISLGVTTFKKGDDYSSINERADIALYKSKETGRNCSSYCP